MFIYVFGLLLAGLYYGDTDHFDCHLCAARASETSSAAGTVNGCRHGYRVWMAGGTVEKELRTWFITEERIVAIYSHKITADPEKEVLSWPLQTEVWSQNEILQ